MWWEIIFNNLPIFILSIFALFFCATEVIKAVRVWKDEGKKKIDDKVEERQQEINIQEEFKKLHKRFDDIDKRLDDFEKRMIAAEQRLKDLTESDMHDIKAWIVEQYHKFYTNQGWIDAFSAETIDKRYADYVKEGGNSYIENLINQLHTLSMDPEQGRYKNKK